MLEGLSSAQGRGFDVSDGGDYSQSRTVVYPKFSNTPAAVNTFFIFIPVPQAINAFPSPTIIKGRDQLAI